MRKWLILPVCAGPALVALLVWSGVEDARQGALLDARIEEAEARVRRLEDRKHAILLDGAPAGEVAPAYIDEVRARAELATLRQEQERRRQPWHARLVREIRRRTGW
jgi:hypothetical protein